MAANPHANPEQQMTRMAREMLEMQIQTVIEVIQAKHIQYSPELLGPLVLAYATNYQTLLQK